MYILRNVYMHSLILCNLCLVHHELIHMYIRRSVSVFFCLNLVQRQNAKYLLIILKQYTNLPVEVLRRPWNLIHRV